MTIQNGGNAEACPITDLAVVQWPADGLSGAANMAVDEALLRGMAGCPLLRVYRWAGPVLSFGYFLAHQDAVAAARAGETLVRRWTGGGMVHHGEDFSWSLLVPRAHPLATRRPGECYVQIHEALGRALGLAGVEGVEVVPAGASAPRAGLCFDAPAPGDVLWRGRKIAGAGQRRTREGLLHQGSIQGPGLVLPPDFPGILAGCLAENPAPWAPAASMLAAADELSTKYADGSWTGRI